MQLKMGADVFSLDEKLVGTVSGVVVNTDTKEVTHLVIQKGHLFTNERLAPVGAIYAADEQRVILHEMAQDLLQLQEFEHVNMIPAESETQWSGSDSVQLGSPLTAPAAVGASPRFIADKVQNIPDGTVAVREKAKVISSDGHQVGSVECIFTALGAVRISVVLIAKGLLFKARKLIPTHLISQVMESEIHLAIDAKYLDNIPEYVPEMQQGELA